MDYLRSLGSAAASSLLQKSGLNLPFSLGDKIYSDGTTLWSLHDATKRDDSSPVSVFIFDASSPSKRSQLPIAKNALRKLRTIRHPDVLKFIDVVETETTIHIVTERIRPLSKVLSNWTSKPASAREEWLIWGLHRIAVALAFVNESCQSTHGNVRVESIFISPSGEWKLGGFDVLSNPKDESPVLYDLGGVLPDSVAYSSPEVKKGGWSSLKAAPLSAADAYAYGILIHSVFNPSLPLPPTTEPPHAAPLPSSRGSIPTTIFPSFKRLLHPNAKGRLTPQGFLDIGMAQQPGDGAGFFAKNGLLKICAGLDGFGLASDAEKNVLLRTLKESADSFPPEFASYKVLPSLLLSLEQGGATAASLLPLVLQLGKNLSQEDYSALVLTPLVKLFEKPDRGTRMALLEHLPEYAEKLDSKTVSDKIWPNLQTGFSDTVPIIREATVRSILLISPKLSERVLNNDLLRQLAKAQMDPEASIRTNTCILLGRIAGSLSYTTKRKVLVPAFSRSLKDGFVHARVAGLMALMATIDCFEADEMASKVLPCIAPCVVDKEKLVRDQAFKALEQYVKMLESHAAKMPETALSPEGGPVQGIPGMPGMLPGQTTLVNSAAGAAGALAGWAMTSFGKTLASSDLQSMIGGGAINRSPSAPPTQDSITANTMTNGKSDLSGPSPTAPALSASSVPGSSGASKGKAMQLGAHKVPGQSNLIDELVAEAEPYEDPAIPGGWGDGSDLIDVTADAGDWGEFASADPPVIVAVIEDAEGDGWGDMLPPPAPTPNLSIKATSPKPAPTPIQPKPKPVVAAKPPPKARTIPTPAEPPRARSISPLPTKSLPVNEGWDASETAWQDDTAPSPAGTAPAVSLATMTKEEKAAEMARRKEERKLRIAQLKEQKKATGGR